eukprot:PhM_4_TR19099/c0_g1_i1/m.29895
MTTTSVPPATLPLNQIRCTIRSHKTWNEVTDEDLTTILVFLRSSFSGTRSPSTVAAGPQHQQRTITSEKSIWNQFWRLASDFIYPYEVEREMYDIEPTHNPVLHPLLFYRMCGELSYPYVANGFAKLGFTIATAPSITYNADTAEVVALRRERHNRATSSLGSISTNSTALSGSTAATRSVSFEHPLQQPSAQGHNAQGQPSPTTSQIGADDVTSCGGEECSTPTPDMSMSGSITRERDLEQQVRDLSRQLRQLRSTSSRATPAPSEQQQPTSPKDPHIILTSPLVASTLGGSVVPLQISALDPDCMPYCISLSMNTERRIVPCTIVDHVYVVFVAPPHPAGSVSVALMCGPGPLLRRYCRSVWLEYRDISDGVAPTTTLPAPQVVTPTLTSPPQPVATLTHHQVNQISAFSHIQRPVQSVPDTSEAPESNFTSEVGDVDGDPQEYPHSSCSDGGDTSVDMAGIASVAERSQMEDPTQAPITSTSSNPMTGNGAAVRGHSNANTTNMGPSSHPPLTHDMLELLTRAQNFFLQPVSRVQYSAAAAVTPNRRSVSVASGQGVHGAATGDGDVSEVSYCATVNSVVPPASPKDVNNLSSTLGADDVKSR